MDYDDPKNERSWSVQQLDVVQHYLKTQHLEAESLPEAPAWLLAPYIAVWQVRVKGSGRLWVISGDLPTDYLPESFASSPREAVRAFAARWARVATNMRAGRKDPEISIGGPEDQAHLADLLTKRAALLKEFAADQELWRE